MKWEPGRQGSGYFKKLLASGSFFDVYLLKYPEGSFIGWHIDPVEGKRHFRLNVFLRRATRGGEFEMKGTPIISTRWFQLFRPDVNRHRVTEVKGRTRYVLSVGFVMDLP